MREGCGARTRRARSQVHENTSVTHSEMEEGESKGVMKEGHPGEEGKRTKTGLRGNSN